MARIRTIKPEFPQSETTGRLSREARLLFILLWTIADDEGRARASSRMVASLLYPYDDDAPGLIGGWLDELERHGCIRRYEVDGATYLVILNWLKHQKIDRPSQSRLPAAPVDLAKPREASRSLAADLGPRTLDQGAGPSRAPAGNLIEEGWKPDAATVAKARALGLTEADITKMLSRFVPLARSKAERCVNWNARFESWFAAEVKKLGRSPPSPNATITKVHVKADTDEWKAWAKHLGKSPPQDSNFGWYFDSKWPPGHQEQAA